MVHDFQRNDVVHGELADVDAPGLDEQDPWLLRFCTIHAVKLVPCVQQVEAPLYMGRDLVSLQLDTDPPQ